MKELDIQNNQIDDYHHLVDLITDNETLEKLNIKGNYMDEESLEAIWVGLNDNIKLKSFLFDSIDKVLEDQTIKSIERELSLNNTIAEDILPKIQL